jgi:prevent-host-death family protein
MPQHQSVAEAKAHLSKYIRQAENGEPLVITRHGKPVAALVRAADLERLERLRAAGPEGGLASLAGGWEGSEELVDLVEGSPRGGSREVPALD